VSAGPCESVILPVAEDLEPQAWVRRPASDLRQLGNTSVRSQLGRERKYVAEIYRKDDARSQL